MRENRKVRVGRVVSNKMQKTVVVAVESHQSHPLYKRRLRRIARFKAHDEQDQCQIGDLVRIVECRPVSKEKHWEVVEILSREKVAEIQPGEIT